MACPRSNSLHVVVIHTLQNCVSARSHLSPLWQVWEKIHQRYLKAKVRQLRSELKNTKKGSKSISNFITKIQSLAEALISAGESIDDFVDMLLNGLPEEYNSFVMMIFSKPESRSLTEIKFVLLVQESQLEKFRQEFSIANTTANIAQVPPPSGHAQNQNNTRT